MERRFNTPGTPTIEVRLFAGRVEISTHDGDETVVHLEALRDNAASRKAVENARVELRKSGGDDLVLVDVREHSSFLKFSMGAEVEVRVQAPAGSNLKTSIASANMVGHGTFGSLEAHLASGDLSVDDVTGDAEVRSASGDVRITSVGGDLSVHSASGEVGIDRVDGSATMRTASGDVGLGVASSSVTVQTASGDVRLGSIAAGRVSVQSASGDLEVSIARGAGAYIDAKSMSGEVSSELEVEETVPGGSTVDLQATSMSGDIRIRSTRETSGSSGHQEPVRLV
jgi:DUF4097 and DUF4098 domain-containing protein YvlB